MSHVFLSRAATEPRSYVSAFENDLLTVLGELGVPDPGRPGGSGGGGTSEGAGPAAEAGVLVALCSPDYYLDPCCGRDWAVFERRLRRGPLPPGPQPAARVLVRWQRVDPPAGLPRPPVLSSGPLAPYARLGLYDLMRRRLGPDPGQYLEVVRELADLVARGLAEAPPRLPADELRGVTAAFPVPLVPGAPVPPVPPGLAGPEANDRPVPESHPPGPPSAGALPDGAGEPSVDHLDGPAGDVVLTVPDKERLRHALATVFHTERRAAPLLRTLGLGRDRWPAFDGGAGLAWGEIFELLDDGASARPAPYRLLLDEAVGLYPSHEVFAPLAARYPHGAARPDRGRTPVPADGLPSRDPETAPAPEAAPDPEADPLRVLFFVASPDGLPAVRADRGFRRIADLHDAGRLRVSFRPAAQVADLSVIRAQRPDIVHFGCHGSEGALLFENADGEEDAVPAARVADILRRYRELADVRLRCLVLNSCDSTAVAELFRGTADVVITHTGPLDVGCANLFAGSFYQEAAGLSRHDPRLAERLSNAAFLVAAETSLAEPTCAALEAGLRVLPAEPPASDEPSGGS
ncbi:effector-associated domain EAD1-containing protein [Streptomyces sp. B6B3]|uniref:effector-associated domain EAD1-containing protein n=1 Tax=Streptomyces sp. B6B3 TaxID=3153570 RepID=UPI00325E2B8E